MLKLIKVLLFVIVLIITENINNCNGHGRLIEPPSRASAWRYGFQTPPNYNDHELYCGGFTRQWNKNGGKCGECGDPWDVPEPRPHEFGGKWGQGVIVRRYNPGDDIVLRVELTASHMGYFEFRICENIAAPQSCLDKHLLKLISGTPSMPQPNDLETRFYPRNGSRIYEIRGNLPNDLKCSQCVLQWRYIAGNNWGTCPDGSGAVGCGAQEEFRACADIAIGEAGASPPLRPVRPGTKLPSRPTIATTETTSITETDNNDELSEDLHSNYIGLIISIITLLIVLCALASTYLYHYHGQRVKQLLRWRREKDGATSHTATNMTTAIPASKEYTVPISIITPPVPPPRTKRLSQNAQDINPNESSVLSGSIVEKTGQLLAKNNSHSPECA